MKRAGRLFDVIVNRQNLREATHRALRGKRAQPDAREFCETLDENLESLAKECILGTIRLGQAHQFWIRDPKPRLITAPCFRERVLHHAIMIPCEPVFERWLIDDTFACRVGRGRDKAITRATRFA
jgi:RNA-directed DNA polymerase